MAKRNIKMGVFVAHTIHWKEANLASGKKEKRNQFLKEIEESVEVAKRIQRVFKLHLMMINQMLLEHTIKII